MGGGKPEEIKAAVALLDQAAEAAPDPVIGDAARLKSAFALLDTAPYKDVEARLTPLMKDGRPYRVQAREALAFAKLMAGNAAGARDDFTVIEQLRWTPPEAPAPAGQRRQGADRFPDRPRPVPGRRGRGPAAADAAAAPAGALAPQPAAATARSPRTPMTPRLKSLLAVLLIAALGASGCSTMSKLNPFHKQGRTEGGRQRRRTDIHRRRRPKAGSGRGAEGRGLRPPAAGRHGRLAAARRHRRAVDGERRRRARTSRSPGARASAWVAPRAARTSPRRRWPPMAARSS